MASLPRGRTDIVGREPRLHSRLVFAYFHGQKDLSQVWMAGQNAGLSVHMPQENGRFERDREESELVERILH